MDMLWLGEIPAVLTLKQIWKQQYKIEDRQIRHRKLKEMPLVREWIRSPFDPEARYGKKRNRHWIGYKVHLTENAMQIGHTSLLRCRPAQPSNRIIKQRPIFKINW